MNYFFRLLCSSLLLALWLSRAALAYGPATHINEAERYLELLHASPLPGLKGDEASLSQRQNLLYFKLGSIFPDIARELPGTYFEPHEPRFTYFLFDSAARETPDEPWKVAFGLGNLAHSSSDMAAQDFVTQYFTVAAHLGELNTIEGEMDTHPGGENEAFVEIGIELAYFEPREYLQMARFFALPPLGAARLKKVIDYYFTMAARYYGEPSQPQSAFDRDENFRAGNRIMTNLPYSLWDHNPIWRWLARTQDLALMSDPAKPPALADYSLNRAEIRRLLRGPGFPLRKFFRRYQEYFRDLGPTILREIEPGNHWYEDWKTWDPNMMKSAALESLNYYLPTIYSVTRGDFVADMAFRNEATNELLVAITSDAAPLRIVATAEIYSATASTQTMTIRVRQDAPGNDYNHDTIVASATQSVSTDPFQYGQKKRDILQVVFEPGPYLATAEGFYLELVADGEEKAFFTSTFEYYQQIEALDMTAAPYAMYSTYDAWPRSLRVIRPISPADR
jgi:hypothetical protein